MKLNERHGKSKQQKVFDVNFRAGGVLHGHENL